MFDDYYDKREKVIGDFETKEEAKQALKYMADYITIYTKLTTFKPPLLFEIREINSNTFKFPELFGHRYY
jgi:hypothetical protein